MNFVFIASLLFFENTLISQAAQSQPPPGRDPRGVYSFDPPATDKWSSRMDFKCPRSAITVAWHPSSSGGVEARISVNGKIAVGPKKAEFLRDLSNRKMVYRIVVTCGRSTDAWIYVHASKEGPGSSVTYRQGRASVQGGAIVRYHGLQPSSASEYFH